MAWPGLYPGRWAKRRHRGHWSPQGPRQEREVESMWRQGDILIQQVDAIPEDATVLPHLILAESEATGHRHAVQHAKGIRLLSWESMLYLDVPTSRATIVHP